MATILYVEDHPPARLLMQAIVSDMTPHQLRLAGSGAEAKTLVPTLKPDLYILDLDLPDTDGLALAQDLHRLHPAPIILVSAYAEAVDQTTMPALISSYLPKPIDPDDAATLIERALARS